MSVVEPLSEDIILDLCTMRRQATAALIGFILLSFPFLFPLCRPDLIFFFYQTRKNLRRISGFTKCAVRTGNSLSFRMRCFTKIFPKREIPRFVASFRVLLSMRPLELIALLPLHNILLACEMICSPAQLTPAQRGMRNCQIRLV